LRATFWRLECRARVSRGTAAAAGAEHLSKNGTPSAVTADAVTDRAPAQPPSQPGNVTPVIDRLVDFSVVYAAEREAIRGVGAPDAVPSVTDGMTGLALSGGGIRSATFCLGVLQALNAAKIIEKIDYLSTVSGGGYIGTSMTVAMSTSPEPNGENFPFGKTGQEVGETDETRHVRDNSRYLVQNGLRSVLSAIVIYLRGIVMNAIIVSPFLLAAAALLVFLMPDTRALATTPDWLRFLPDAVLNTGWPLSLLGAGILMVLLLVYAFAVSVSPIVDKPARQRAAFCASVALVVCVLPLVFEAHFAVMRLMFNSSGPAYPPPEHPSKLIDILKQVATWATPLAAAVMPFVRGIAETALSSAKAQYATTISKWISRVVLLAVAAVVPLLLWLAVVQLAYWAMGVSECLSSSATGCTTWGLDTWNHAPALIARAIGQPDGIDSSLVSRRDALVYVWPALLLLLPWLFLNVNANSLHQLYRDRLGSAFLFRRVAPEGSMAIEGADTFKFKDIKPGRSPYHLINTALNLPGSHFANRRGRNADFFMFSRLFTGSEATGYVSTALAEAVTDGLNIGTAMAISGAAAAPNMGVASMRPLSATIALLNVRLGRWLRHPADILRYKDASPFKRQWFGTPGPGYLLREAFFKSGDNVEKTPDDAKPAGFVFLTDGGHIENLGVYELLRRRCAVIVAVDAEADPDFQFGSLVQLERFARIDLGIRIVVDTAPIGAGSLAVTRHLKKKHPVAKPGPHVALGLIDYPPPSSNEANDKSTREKGVLIYIKASVSGDESGYVMAYKTANADFPQESTMDQLFTEEQVEVYRALGEHIGRRFIGGDDAPCVDPDHRDDLVALVVKFFPEIKLSQGTREPVIVVTAEDS
jgi:Patatin-like phospholipase